MGYTMNDRKSVLLVEDEPVIREGLVDFLQLHGFAVTVAKDGLEAQRLAQQQRFDVILLDLMLPLISGEQLCLQWRQKGLTTPIIMLTAKGLQHERIAGLDLGADDYVTKPFSLEELLARIRAVLRRIDPNRSVGQSFQFGNWQIDLTALKAIGPNRQVRLTHIEAQIVQFLAANPNRVISREELYESIWHEKITELGTRTIDVHIANLRGKLEIDPDRPMLIKTVRGLGYIYER